MLCYHGFAIGDEAQFRPGLFMEMQTFRCRIDYLLRKQVPVLPLGEAVQLLREGRLPANATVITIDDGFFGTLEAARTCLGAASLPATLYVTSYYAEKGTPVFRLAVQYMLWKTREDRFDVGRLGIGLSGVVRLVDSSAKMNLSNAVMQFGEERLDEEGRGELARKLARELSVDYDELVASRRLSLMNSAELREIQELGVDVQLHTHRHRFPVDEALALREVHDNRRWLENLAQSPLEHFCYPSGEWSPKHLPWLMASGVKSAVTCDTGLNDRTAEPLALKRFLDGEDVSQIEFEAELSGCLSVLRRWRPRSEIG